MKKRSVRELLISLILLTQQIQESRNKMLRIRPSKMLSDRQRRMLNKLNIDSPSKRPPKLRSRKLRKRMRLTKKLNWRRMPSN